MGLQLTKKQSDLFKQITSPEHNYTHIFLFGGARSGKTILILLLLVLRALKQPKSTHLIVRSTLQSFEGTIMGVGGSMEWLLRKTGFKKKYVKNINKVLKTVTFKNGSIIRCIGIDKVDEDGKLGFAAYSIYFNECTAIDYAKTGLMLSRFTVEQGSVIKAKVFYDCNPTNKLHWTYRKFIDFVDPITNLPLDNKDDFFVATINPADNTAIPGLLENLKKIYVGQPDKLQRFGYGVYADAAGNDLFNMDDIYMARKHQFNNLTIEELKQIMDYVCIGVDPAGGKDEGEDLTGIVVVGRAFNETAKQYEYFVLEDASDKYEPLEWSRKLYFLSEKWDANKIVVEKNYGGAYVLPTINSYYQSGNANYKLNIEMVTATRGFGKEVRAEPVSVLYKTNLVHHISKIKSDFSGENRLEKLEEQMVSWTGEKGEKSPDRMDALVYGFYYWLDPNKRKAKDGSNEVVHQGYY